MAQFRHPFHTLGPETFGSYLHRSRMNIGEVTLACGTKEREANINYLFNVTVSAPQVAL